RTARAPDAIASGALCTGRARSATRLLVAALLLIPALLVLLAEAELIAGRVDTGVDMAVDVVRRALLDLLGGGVERLLGLVGVLEANPLALFSASSKPMVDPLSFAETPRAGRCRQPRPHPVRDSN